MVDDWHQKPPQAARGDVHYGRVTPRSPGEAIKPTFAPPPPPRVRRRPQRGGGFLSAISAFLTLVLILAVAAGSAIYFGRGEFYAQGPLRETRIVTVKGGNQIVAEALQREGVINHPLIFVVGLHVLGANDAIKAGEYAFKAGASMKDVMDTLVAGRSVQYPVTIPEGLTSDQIVARLLANDLLAGDVKPAPVEGTLLPETYMAPRGTSRQSIIDRMVVDHRKAVALAWESRASDLPLKSSDELVILASIIEKETAVEAERARVAAVFVNRLRKGMKLQSDPTIVYGIVGGKGTLGRGIRKSEIAEATPYNTYVVDGLPAGPIANPGRASLMAAANPANTDDLYFVADGTGGHVFAKTYEEHKRNVAAWRKIEAGQGAQPAAGVDRAAPDEEETQTSVTPPPVNELADAAASGAGADGIIRAFDASEGTRLDPLKNKTYDLTSPKTVPQLPAIR